MTDTTTDPDAPAQDTPPEVHTPEVVQPTTDVAPIQSGAHAAIERAAEAALAMPGVPGRDEFLSLAMQARVLSMSGAAPKAVRNNPHVAFHVAMVGRDLGISPSASLELIDVIEGKRDSRTGEVDYRLSLSPQLLNGQLRRLGLGSIVPAYRDEWRCLALPLGPGGLDRECAKVLPDHAVGCSCDVMGPPSEFTWEMARRAGLVGKLCEPGDHKMETRTKGDRSWQACGCNQGYITYPDRMLWWRASGFCADDYFPEAGLGLYSPEALGAVVDEDGRPIDPATVALPDGYEPAELPAPAAPPVVERGDGEALWDLQVRIRALPDEQRALMADRWKESSKLTHEVNGARLPIRPHQLPATSVASAESMLTGFEKLAQRGGWSPTDAHEAVTAQVAEVLVWALAPWVSTTPATQAPAAPGPDAGSTGTPDSTEAQGAAHSPEPPTGEFDRQTTARWLDSLDDLSVADLLTEYELDGAGTKVAKRRRVLDFLQALAQPATEA